MGLGVVAPLRWTPAPGVGWLRFNAGSGLWEGRGEGVTAEAADEVGHEEDHPRRHQRPLLGDRRARVPVHLRAVVR